MTCLLNLDLELIKQIKLDKSLKLIEKLFFFGIISKGRHILNRKKKTQYSLKGKIFEEQQLLQL